MSLSLGHHYFACPIQWIDKEICISCPPELVVWDCGHDTDVSVYLRQEETLVLRLEMRKGHEVSTLYYSALRNIVRRTAQPNLGEGALELGSTKSYNLRAQDWRESGKASGPTFLGQESAPYSCTSIFSSTIWSIIFLLHQLPKPTVCFHSFATWSFHHTSAREIF